MCFCGQVSTFSTAMHIVIHMFRSMNMLEEIKAKWDEILLNIKEEHDISEVSYRTWLLPLIPDSVDKDILTILVPDSAFISYVKKKYEFLLTITIEEITGFQCKLDFKLKSDVKEPEKENRLINVNNNTVSQLALQNANLNPRYTFDTFVVGKNNNLDMLHPWLLRNLRARSITRYLFMEAWDSEKHT